MDPPENSDTKVVTSEISSVNTDERAGNICFNSYDKGSNSH